MNYAAACTTRVRLGCAVFLTTLRSPVHMAKMLTTLDHLSQGRLDVGVGLGAPRHDAAFGVDSRTRVARFTEGIRLMKALWTEPQVTFAGRFWQLENAPMEPKPVQSRIRRCGSAPATRMRCAAPCATATPSSVRARPRLNSSPNRSRPFARCLDEAGRDPASFPIAKRVYIGIDEQKDRAGQETRGVVHDQLWAQQCTSRSRSGARQTSAPSACERSSLQAPRCSC